MKRRFVIPILIVAFPAVQIQAQSRTMPAQSASIAVDHKMREAALNAILAFRPDLYGDSVKIARCRLAAGAPDTVEQWILPRLRALLISPFKSAQGSMACSVMVFQRPGAKVLWLDSMVEVHRTGGIPLGPLPGLSFEVSFQWLGGANYRRFEQYEVHPQNPSGTEWRVVRYEFTGEEWMEPWGGARTPP
jgi:hypothetical protein